MKVKMGDVVDSFNMLNVLTQNYVFDLKLSYDLGKTLKSCKGEKELYDEIVAECTARYTVKDAADRDVIDPKRLAEYKAEIKKFRDEPVEIWGKKPIQLKTLESAIILGHKQQKPEDKDFVPMLAPALLSPLDWLIVADEEEVEKTQAASGD